MINLGSLTGHTQSLTQGRYWTPRDIFRGNVLPLGAWYDPSDLSTMFQDTAGTIPVTTVGQSVSLLKDKSGNNFHLIAYGVPPTLAQVSGKYCLLFPSSRTGLLGYNGAPFYLSGLPIMYSMAIGVTALINQIYMGERSTTTGNTINYPIYQQSTTGVVLFRNDDNNPLENFAVSGFYDQNVNVVISCIDRLTSAELYKNDIMLGNKPYARSRPITPNRFFIFGENGAAPTYGTGYFYGAIIATTNYGLRQRSQINKWLKSKMP